MPKRKRPVLVTPSPKLPAVRDRSFCEDSASVVLSDLPEEILRKIFEMLDPQSVVAISKLNIHRLDNLLCDLKFADFSTCNAITSEDLTSYFQKGREKHLKVLNLNNLYCVTFSTLSTCIEKCKNITKLYLLNCGLKCFKINRILDSCTHLEELYWSVQHKDDTVQSIQKTGQNKNVKNICLQVHTDDSRCSYLICVMLIDKCPNANFVFNFSPSYETSLPALSASRNMSLQLRLRQDPTISFNILGFSSVEKCFNSVGLCHFAAMISLGFPNLRNMTSLEWDKMLRNFLTYHSPFLQVFDDDQHLSEIPELPCESVESLVLIMNGKPHTLDHLDKIKKATGKALKNLSLYSSKHTSIPQRQGMNPGPSIQNMRIMPLEPDIPSQYVQDVLGQLVVNSSNIRVLDLSELHMLVDFPFPSLCSLKNLKVLSLSTCCFSGPVCEPSTKKIEVLPEILEEFTTFITKCNDVEKFTICDCKFDCRSCYMEDVLPAISKWPNLKHLTVFQVKELRTCQFLKSVAGSCPKLTSLELIFIGVPRICHFLPNLESVLTKSKELKFLRINQPGLYPMNSDIWKHIHKAQALEGICLLTHLNTAIENRTIVDAISKLPHLHLFHLMSSTDSENFRNAIKRVMTNNGVKQNDVLIRRLFLHPDTSFLDERLTYQSKKICYSRHLPLD